MSVVEVSIKLDKNPIYYHDMLTKHGLNLLFSCITHDVYYTDKELNGLTESQMKESCIRLRYCNGFDKEGNDESTLVQKEKELVEKGYHKVFDTSKFDFQYGHETMKSRVQVQDIKDIGLVVYYDNPDYYHLPDEEQRALLITELNTYGFDFSQNTLDLDKLRTLYYGKEMFSTDYYPLPSEDVQYNPEIGI